MSFVNNVISVQVTIWVTKEIVSEPNLEDRASVISYFIQTANVSKIIVTIIINS